MARFLRRRRRRRYGRRKKRSFGSSRKIRGIAKRVASRVIAAREAPHYDVSKFDTNEINADIRPTTGNEGAKYIIYGETNTIPQGTSINSILGRRAVGYLDLNLEFTGVTTNSTETNIAAPVSMVKWFLFESKRNWNTDGGAETVVYKRAQDIFDTRWNDYQQMMVRPDMSKDMHKQLDKEYRGQDWRLLRKGNVWLPVWDKNGGGSQMPQNWRQMKKITIPWTYINDNSVTDFCAKHLYLAVYSDVPQAAGAGGYKNIQFGYVSMFKWRE